MLTRTNLLISSQVRGWPWTRCPCSSDASPLRKSKRKRRRQASGILCIFIPKRLNSKQDLAEPTWFCKIKFPTIPGVRDMKAKTLFYTEIKQLTLFTNLSFEDCCDYENSPPNICSWHCRGKNLAAQTSSLWHHSLASLGLRELEKK